MTVLLPITTKPSINESHNMIGLDTNLILFGLRVRIVCQNRVTLGVDFGCVFIFPS